MKRILAAALMGAALMTQVPTDEAQAQPPAGCSSPESRQFDFWVGRWDVYPTGKDNLVAHSLIESLYGGCGIRENWMPLKGTGGGSLNSWIPKEKTWKQVWVDSSGSWAEFKGGMKGKSMVIEGLWPGVNNGKDAVVRITYTPNADKSVRQSGEMTSDGGKTWSPAFDFTYKPAAPVPAKTPA
jgi:hypothetical protein